VVVDVVVVVVVVVVVDVVVVVVVVVVVDVVVVVVDVVVVLSARHITKTICMYLAPDRPLQTRMMSQISRIRRALQSCGRNTICVCPCC
jgi:hypothetical protein